MSIKNHLKAAVLVLTTLMASCSSESTPGLADSVVAVENQNDKPAEGIREGSICTVDDGDGKFGIVKVLVLTPDGAHIRVYKNKYDQRPDSVDLKTLSLGSIDDPDGFGVGHIPLHRSDFYRTWRPVEIAYEKVTDEELEGYKMWLNQ